MAAVPGGEPIIRNRLLFIVVSFFLARMLAGSGICGEPSVTAVPALSGQWVSAIASGDGGVWVGTAGGQVTFLRGGSQAGRTYGPADGLPPGKVNSLAVLEGKVYAGTEQGFGLFDGTSWRIIPSAERKSLRNVFLRAEPGGRGVWIDAVDLGGGLLRLEGDRWQFLGGRGVGLMNHIQAFAFDGGTAWLGSVSSGVFAKKGDELRTFRSKEGLPSETVYALEAYGGTVWAGTSKGAARYAEGRWTPYPKSPSNPLTAVFCMAAGPKALYLGGPEGLARHSGGRFEPFPPGDPALRIGRVNALLFHEGALYVGAENGLLRVEGW